VLQIGRSLVRSQLVPMDFSLDTTVVKVPCYKSEGRCFDPSWCQWIFHSIPQWLRCRVTNRKVAGSIPAGANGFFIDIKSFRSHYGPGVDSASNRNEYRDYFLAVKSGRCVRLTTLPPSCAVVMKSGSLNFLEHSGSVQACNETALPLPLQFSLQVR
jgi:hypothetical protein